MTSAHGKFEIRSPRPGDGASEHVQEILRRALEEDRARIAQTVHDDFGLLLMLLRTRLQSTTDNISRLSLSGGKATSASIDAALRELAAAGTILQELLDSARRLQNDLRPVPLDSYGLAKALESLKRTFAGAGLTVVLNTNGLADRRFDTELETTAYWIAQHCLTNILRHSGVDHATVTAHIVQSHLGEVLHIVTEDAGKGFTVGPIGNTFGLTAMYDRAALIGGTVVVDSAPRRGTRVIVDLPCAPTSSDGSVRKVL